MSATTDILKKDEKYYMYSDLTINTKKKQRLVIVHSDNLFLFSIFSNKYSVNCAIFTGICHAIVSHWMQMKCC